MKERVYNPRTNWFGTVVHKEHGFTTVEWDNGSMNAYPDDEVARLTCQQTVLILDPLPEKKDKRIERIFEAVSDLAYNGFGSIWDARMMDCQPVLAAAILAEFDAMRRQD